MMSRRRSFILLVLTLISLFVGTSAAVWGQLSEPSVGFGTFRVGATADRTDDPILTLDSSQYCIGASWRLSVSNAAQNTLIRLLGTSNGQSWEIEEWAQTDANGSYTAEGTFAGGAEGSYSLRVEIGGWISNSVFLAISSCTAVDLNGSYLAPSGANIFDAVASATTHPLGDRRGQGQVYEVNRGIPVMEGNYTPFSDDFKKPQALSGIDLRGKSFQFDVDLQDLSLWQPDVEFLQIGAGRQADPTDTQTEEFFVFIYRYGDGFALYMETDWALYRPATTYYAAPSETNFRVRVDVNTVGTEALLTVIPLNGATAGTVHASNPLPLDIGNDNVTSASFFAGFTQNFINLSSAAKAIISNFRLYGDTGDRADDPMLTLDSSQYCIGTSWRLSVSNAAQDTSIRLLGTTNGQSWEIEEWAHTDSNGSFTAEGTFAGATEGSYSLRVEIGGWISNSVFLRISSCTVLYPVAGLTLTEVVWPPATKENLSLIFTDHEGLRHLMTSLSDTS